MTAKPAKPSKQPGVDPVIAIPLPARYDPAHVYHFFGRDSQGLSERVSEAGLEKGVLLDDVPAVLAIGFAPDLRQASCTIAVDAELTAGMREQAHAMCLGLLGLRLDPASFTAFARKDALFGPLLKRQRGLRIVQSASIFEALTWAIMGQQINVAFAVSLRRTLIELGGRRHSSGLWCYPSARDGAGIDVAQLTSRQFSRSKAETILRLAQLIADGQLDLAPTASNTLEQISAALLAIKGIGPWTVNYAMLRGYAHADCSLHGDVAVRKAIHLLTGAEARLDAAGAEAFLQQYSPHRTMAAAHLWASLASKQDF